MDFSTFMVVLNSSAEVTSMTTLRSAMSCFKRSPYKVYHTNQMPGTNKAGVKVESTTKIGGKKTILIMNTFQ